MGFMTKEEIKELRKKNGILDAGTTKRTCITCNRTKDCRHLFLALHKRPDKECALWMEGQRTCGICKHSALFPDIRYSLYCARYSDDRIKLEVDYNQNRCDGWELSEDLERLG